MRRPKQLCLGKDDCKPLDSCANMSAVNYLCRMGKNSVITLGEGSSTEELTLRTDCVDCSTDVCSNSENTFMCVVVRTTLRLWNASPADACSPDPLSSVDSIARFTVQTKNLK